MLHINLKLTATELDLLSSLASDQVFRREFIDSRLPGYKHDPVELGVAKKLIERLRVITQGAKGGAIPRRKGALVLHSSTTVQRSPDGL